MTGHSLYETLRQIADSYGLAAMTLAFLVLGLWPFLPGSKAKNDEAANVIFKDDSDG